MRPHGWCILALVAVAVALLWRGLVSSELITSVFGFDGSAYFYHVYSYAQEGLAQGEFRTWNPYIFSGNPVVGAFQYTMFYPFRLLCAPLPIPMALNWIIFLDICAAGISMYAWVYFRCKSAAGAFVAGVIFMLCGSLFARVPVGHYSPANAMVWMPLVFLGVDGWCRQRRSIWVIVAAVGAALQMLGGHPQYFYFTALMVAIYSLWILLEGDQKVKTAAGLLAIYPLALLLSAVEFVPGYLLSREAVRAGGALEWWASVASMQFKDFLFILVPGFFGGIKDQSYWDNAFIWEMWNYSGLGGLLLACVGFLKISLRDKFKYGFLALLALVLALGAYTPLFGIMRDYVPMYSSFRAMGRWTIFFSLFIAMLAGTGVGKIVSGEKIPRGLAWGFLGLGATFLLFGFIFRADNPGGLYRILADTLTFRPSHRQNLLFADRQAAAQIISANALFLSGGLAVILGTILLFVKRRAWLAGLLIAVTMADLMIFAAPLVQYFDESQVAYPELAAAAKKFAPDDRNLNLVNGASSMTLRQEALMGNDSVRLKRYMEFIAATQGIPMASVTTDVSIFRNSPAFQLLRGRYAFVPVEQGFQVVELQRDVLPRFLVIGNYRVLAERDEVLQTLTAPFFDFRREVIVETKPDFPPQIVAPENTITVLSSAISRWVVEVETAGPGILLMTDSYAKGWRARALPGSVQSSYDLLPADWAVRGIPLLKPGRHVIEIKYTPPGLALGVGVTLTTLIALAIYAALTLRRRRIVKPLPPPA